MADLIQQPGVFDKPHRDVDFDYGNVVSMIEVIQANSARLEFNISAAEAEAAAPAAAANEELRAEMAGIRADIASLSAAVAEIARRLPAS